MNPQRDRLTEFADAVRRSASHRADSWEKARDRLVPLVRPELRPSFRIGSDNPIFAAGSCFARHVEEHLATRGFKVPACQLLPERRATSNGPARAVRANTNKNTATGILQELEFARDLLRRNEHLGPADLERFVDRTAAGKAIDNQIAFKSLDFDFLLERRRKIADVYSAAFRCETIILTFGMIEDWWDDRKEIFVRRMPARSMARHKGRYHFYRHSFEETKSTITRIIEMIREENPSANFIVTVSPIPLKRTFSGEDVIVANAYGKSVLRAACGAVASEFERVDYFPSYEMVTQAIGSDVYEADLRHVRARIVEHIVTWATENYLEATPRAASASASFTLAGAEFATPGRNSGARPL